MRHIKHIGVVFHCYEGNLKVRRILVVHFYNILRSATLHCFGSLAALTRSHLIGDHPEQITETMDPTIVLLTRFECALFRNRFLALCSL